MLSRFVAAQHERWLTVHGALDTQTHSYDRRHINSVVSMDCDDGGRSSGGDRGISSSSSSGGAMDRTVVELARLILGFPTPKSVTDENPDVKFELVESLMFAIMTFVSVVQTIYGSTLSDWNHDSLESRLAVAMSSSIAFKFVMDVCVCGPPNPAPVVRACVRACPSAIDAAANRCGRFLEPRFTSSKTQRRAMSSLL